MARPRRAQPTPSWSSSSRMSKPNKKHASTATTLERNTNVQVVLYDRPRYIAGISTVSSRPITLVPPRHSKKSVADTKNAYIVDKVVTPFDGWGPQAATAEEYDTDEEDARYAADPARRRVQRVLNYVVGWRDEPYAYELVPCTRILDYVSPYVLEAYEFELCERQRRQEEQRQQQQQQQLKKKHSNRPHFKKPEAENKPAAKVDKAARKGEKKEKKEKTNVKDENRVQRALAQKRDENGKFLRKGGIASTPARNSSAPMPSSASLSGQVQLASPVVTLSLTPSKRAGLSAGLSQPVISLSSIPSLSSLSPSKQRAVPGQSAGLAEHQTMLPLKRPYDSFAEQSDQEQAATTETDTEEEEEDEVDEEEEGSEESEEDELYASLPRVTPVPLPAFASASASASSHSSRSTPTFIPPPLPQQTSATSSRSATSSARKVTRIQPPLVIGMRSEAPFKKVKVEANIDAKNKIQEKKKEKRITPIPPPVFHTGQKSQPKGEPSDTKEGGVGEEEDLYEVDRLEGDCYTYIDDNAEGVPQDGTPAPKKLVQYFSVRWKGNWPPDQNPTWEPAENLPPRMVQQYLRRLARKEQALKQSQLDGTSQYEDELLLDPSSDDDGRVSQDDFAPIVSSDII